jgi:hypothetical protein
MGDGRGVVVHSEHSSNDRNTLRRKGTKKTILLKPKFMLPFSDVCFSRREGMRGGITDRPSWAASIAET